LYLVGFLKLSPASPLINQRKELPMWSGTVDSIHIAPAAKAPMQVIEKVEAVPGAGLSGDRYFLKQGTFFKPEADFELTLIEAEAIEAAEREYRVSLAPGAARRNVVTRGVPLNHLVGCDFMIGAVKVHGIRLCEPCGHLEALTGLPLIKALRHRAGLRAQILTQGVIRVGDAVAETTSDPTFRQLLRGKGAHLDPVASLTDVPAVLAGRTVEGYPHSIWQLVSHMNYWMEYERKRIAGERPRYPQHAIESWPSSVAPGGETEWRAARERLSAHLDRFAVLSESAPEDLARPVAVIDGSEASRSSSTQAVLWQILVHNSYHAGQIALLLRCFGMWPPRTGGDTW
jgi:uncharacterized damage-inducible protein DinB